MPDPPDRLVRLFPLLAGALAFAVYLRTVAPTVYGLDSAELTTGAYVLGIVHAPGSPSYLLLAHLFTWLPFGDVGYRVNVFSACAAAGAVSLFYLVLLQLACRPLIALAVSWFLAFTYYFWVTAVTAELYALHLCFLAALLYLALRWRAGGRPRDLWAFALLFGIGLGNHLSLAVLTPGFTWLLIRDAPQIWRRPAVPALGLLAALLGSAVYLYLPLRADAPMNYARAAGVDVASWEGFWWMVSGRMFESKLFAVPAAQLGRELGSYIDRLWSNFLGVGLLIGVVGLLAGVRQRRVEQIGLLLMFGAHLGFVLTYAVTDKELMLAPTYLIWGLWLGLGAERIYRQLARTGFAVGGLAGAFLISALAVAVNFSYLDLSKDRSARERGELLLQSLPARAAFIGTWTDASVMEYLQLVEARRPDIRIENLFFLSLRGDGWSDLVTELAHLRPVYTSADRWFAAHGIPSEYDERCDCYRIHVNGGGS